MSGTSLLDLQVFLQSKVFPHLPQHDIDHLLSCTKVVLLKRGEKRSRKALYVVYRGRVRIDSEELVSGEYRLGKHIEAIEESIVLEIDEKCVSGVQLAPPVIVEEECRINRLVKRSPITVSPTTSVIDAVKIMAEHGVSSVVVVDGEKPIGIFTDTDLRKLVASGGELYKPIAEYMSRNLITISSEASCLEAVYRMMLYNIKHLVVVDAFEKLVGVVTVRDIAYIYGPYHLYYIRRIRSSHNIEELLKVYRDFIERICRDASKFIDPQEIPDPVTLTRMTTTVYHALIERVAGIAAKKLDIDSNKVAYLVLGSGGRYEQFLVTDRDTMLVYSGLSESHAREFAEMVEDMLDRIGFPSCEKGYTTRRLLYSLEELDEEVGKLVSSIGQDEESIILLSLFFDAESVWGREDFARTVREVIAKYASHNKRPIVRMMTMFRPPLGAFGRLQKRFDIKVRGLAPIVMAVKGVAMVENVAKYTHTLDRLNALVEKNIIPRDLGVDVREAYVVLLRYAIWLQAVKGRREVITSELTGGELQMLKAALRTAERLVDYVRSHYG